MRRDVVLVAWWCVLVVSRCLVFGVGGESLCRLVVSLAEMMIEHAVQACRTVQINKPPLPLLMMLRV